MKYIVRESDYPMEFPDEQKNTAITLAEVMASKGRKVSIEVVADDAVEKDMVEVTRCADCKMRHMYVNPSGRLVQECEEHGIEVNGDFYCPLGPLNRIEE